MAADKKAGRSARKSRSAARSRAAAGGGGKPVKLLKDPSKMTAADRVRYFLGLPQGYPVNEGHARKIQSRLAGRFVDREPAHGYMDQERARVERLRDAPLPQLDAALLDFGMVKPGEMAGSVPIKVHGESFQEGYLTPFEMLLLEDTIQNDLPGARSRGEARKKAAKRPHNPRMGPTKRKHGGY